MSLSNRLFQGAELRQEMKINPRLYQAMELLYMPLLDLQTHLKAELAENPFLEMTEADASNEVSLDEVAEQQQDGERSEDEIDWEGILLDGFEPGGQRRGQFEEKDFHEATPTTETDLRDHLMEQLRHLPLDDREQALGEEIVGNIEDSGFLSCDLATVVECANRWVEDVRKEALSRAGALADPEERAEELAEVERLFRPYTEEDAERLLERIQEMDPPGVGARDVRESILLQLRRDNREESLPYALVHDHFDDLLNHRWTEIARGLGIPARAVQEAADEIALLDPKPGLQHTPDDDPYILPDLIVEKIDGEYHVFLNDTSLPRLRISRAYREVARNRNQFKGENRDFIAAKLNSANWMIQAIEQRRQTMLKVMKFIVDRQRDFFERGIQHLRPLTLREVAEHIEMHESTVSRVTNEKYVQTPRGVYPLKFFFSSGLSTASGEDISARGVRDKIRVLVSQENPKKPLTDQRIVQLLEGEGIQIARRTVAKYRDQLGILPARMRKRV
jgi:RNA polymerase sigma-54 factor